VSFRKLIWTKLDFDQDGKGVSQGKNIEVFIVLW
jgi:hypothetical protein